MGVVAPACPPASGIPGPFAVGEHDGAPGFIEFEFGGGGIADASGEGVAADPSRDGEEKESDA
jgi:hypothetical protein